MTRKQLRELKRCISAHFYNEAEIMKDMLESDLSDIESKELEQFIRNHPFSELSMYIQNLRNKKLSM